MALSIQGPVRLEGVEVEATDCRVPNVDLTQYAVGATLHAASGLRHRGEHQRQHCGGSVVGPNLLAVALSQPKLSVELRSLPAPAPKCGRYVPLVYINCFSCLAYDVV